MGRNRHSPSNSLHNHHRPPPLVLEPSTGLLVPSARRRPNNAPPLVVEPVVAPAANGAGNAFPPALSLRPPSRAESTRVKLQRQRLQEHHAAIVVSQRLPGLKTSTAFFASLRTNLRLNASPPPSPLPTPPPPSSTIPPSFQPLPSPLYYQHFSEAECSESNLASTSPSTYLSPATHLAAAATMAPSTRSADHAAPPTTTTTTSTTVTNQPTESDPSDPLAGVPELHTYVATTEEDRTAALKLIADSIAQMRQVANSSLILHPLHLALLIGLLAAAGPFMHNKVFKGDLTPTVMTLTGILMGYLLVCRGATQGFLVAAEKLDMNWLETQGDEVLVTRFGEEVIGGLVLGFDAGEATGKKKGGSANAAPSKAIVRAWTVRMRYRGKGVGGALLEEAVKIARAKGVSDSGITLANGEVDGGVHSPSVLPAFYSGVFNKRDTKARLALENALASAGPVKGGRRKRGGSS